MADAKHKNVFCALTSAQQAMGPLVKGSTNPAFKSKYADLSDLVQAVREPLGLNGLAFFHMMVDGTIMRTSIVHGESDTRIECDVPLIVDRQNMQGMKSAITYAKRIGLESLTGIAPEDDDGNEAAKSPMVETQKPKADEKPKPADKPPFDYVGRASTIIDALKAAPAKDTLKNIWEANARDLKTIKADEPLLFATIEKAKTEKLAALQNADLGGDVVPF